MRTLTALVIGVGVFVSTGVAAPPPPAGGRAIDPGMQVYDSKYYIIHSDLPPDDVKEAIIRMNKMAEEYHNRTAGFSGAIRQKLPFYLFKSADEYYQAGGMPGSAGVFTGDQLMAIAGEDANGQTWQIVQHEGFHQFAHAVIRGDLPAWLNEGIAEYFGESVFTGDGFVTGVIPPDRLRRLKEEIKGNRLKSIKNMMLLSYVQWNSGLSILNYDEGWSMVHFLAHAEGGKYQQPFVGFMQAIARGTPWPSAWAQNFGNAAGFEDKWKQYWLDMPDDPTAALYDQATCATLTSFLARARAQKQTFDSIEEFVSAAEKGEVKTGNTVEDWLPPALLKRAVESAKRSSTKWSLRRVGNGLPEIEGVRSDGTRLTGTFLLRGAHASGVAVDVDDTAAVLEQARQKIADGKKDAAKTMLQHALKSHPRSALAGDVRDLITQAK